MNFGIGLSYLTILFIAANLAMNLVIPHNEMIWISAIMASTAMLLTIMRPLFGFAIIVAELLGAGFFATGTAFYRIWPLSMQLEAIHKIVVFMLATGILWLLVLEAKRLVKAYSESEKQLTQLRKFEEDVSVLTLSEFVSRAETIFIGLKRRQEQGFFVRIAINPDNKWYALKPLWESVSQAALRSVRNQYDLVGKASDQELILLLQNTRREGVEIVLQRLHKVLNNTVTVPENAYDTYVHPAPAMWTEALLLITGTSLPSRRDRKVKNEPFSRLGEEGPLSKSPEPKEDYTQIPFARPAAGNGVNSQANLRDEPGWITSSDHELSAKRVQAAATVEHAAIARTESPLPSRRDRKKSALRRDRETS